MNIKNKKSDRVYFTLPIIGLIIIVAVVLTLVKLMNSNRSANSHSGKSALDILKERYARGEMDKEEFEERRKDLL